jgi:hypothetical protein
MLKRITWGLVVVGVCTLCVAGTAAAVVVVAPEIDAGSAVSALTILVGSLAVLGERLRRK